MSGGWRVPLAPTELGPAERAALLEAFDGGWPALGPRTAQFEERFAAFAEVPHAVAVSSGTAALHLALATLDLAAGDEVVVPSLTFVATASAVVAAGGKPVFADIAALDDPTLSAATVEPCLGPRSRAVVAMHYGGCPAEMAALRALAAERGLLLLEDAAHAPGASLDGRPAGGLADLACFSFYANKNLTTVEGGMVTTADPIRAERIRRLRSHGLPGLSWERHQGASPDRDVSEPGFNFRLDDLRAAIGLAQLESLGARNERRAVILEAYRKALAGQHGRLGLVGTGIRPGRASANHLAALLVAGGAEVRNRLRSSLEGRGIQTSHHYRPVHQLSYYREAGLRLPRTEAFAEAELTLPLFSHMSSEQVELVCAALAAG